MSTIYSTRSLSSYTPASTPSFRGVDLERAQVTLDRQRQGDPALDRLCRILEIPSKHPHEGRLVRHVAGELEASGCRVETDTAGNLYATKGEAGSYPLFMAHLDTIHEMEEVSLWSHDGWLGAMRPGTSGGQVGVGGDDKCGVFLCLELARRLPALKVALFVGEECGCLGSRQADRRFFADVGYGIEFDCPEIGLVTQVCSGVELFRKDGEFWSLLGPIVERHMGNPGLDMQQHPYTDVRFVRGYGRFPCANLSAGYYALHSPGEVVSLPALRRILAGAIEIGEVLGTRAFDEGTATLSADGLSVHPSSSVRRPFSPARKVPASRSGKRSRPSRPSASPIPEKGIPMAESPHVFQTRAVDNIPMMDLDGVPTIFDTGACYNVSVGSSAIPFLGKALRAAPDPSRRLLGNPASLSPALREAEQLLGHPILDQYDVAVRLRRGELEFSAGELELPVGLAMPLGRGSRHGLPVVEIEVNGERLRAAFDTASSVSIVPARILRSCPVAFETVGVFTASGTEYQATVHSVPARINGQPLALLAMAKDGHPGESSIDAIGGVDMLLGAEALQAFDCLISRRRHRIAFVPAA